MASAQLPPGQEFSLSQGKLFIKKNIKSATLRKFAESLPAMVTRVYCDLE